MHAPAEHAPHARTWTCWPSTPAVYGDDTAYYESVQETLARLAAAIAGHEPVSLCAAAGHHPLARRLCGPAVTLVDIPTDDMWARDSGPVFVRNGALYTPQFGDARADANAAETFARLYPGRRIVALDVDRICENGGGIHCVTQQEPAP